ncbi:MAG: UDP-N-acetylmuramoyl-L-alanine--D-glutamate ligase [Thermodesulfobacteriota bacterium]|nr:UDP-N-acetylmuramoyl-L-alanine--D-glutamate ligase [Thermodesulfobacteriota bacterium]
MAAEKKPYTLVAGLGRSGMSIARFLNARGFHVVATDKDPLKRERGKGLEKEGIDTEIGFHRFETFENAEKIITSPGIPLDMEYFQRAREKGVPVTGELDLFSRYIKPPVIAVTGTNGKTTVTTMISQMLKASGLSVFTCGNIGIPMVDYFSEKKGTDWIVAEISSFQLDTAEFFRPDIAVLLNISEDHLNRYENFKAYQASKWRIFKNQTKNQIAVLNHTLIPELWEKNQIKSDIQCFCPESEKKLFKEGQKKCTVQTSQTNALIEKNKIIITGSDPEIIDISQTRLAGWHNRENLAAAVLAVRAAKGSVSKIETWIERFKGLSHRLEYAGMINNAACYNDSKATNCDAVIRALESFDQDIILIMGGQEKNTDFSCLGPLVKTRVKKLIAMGDSKSKIHDVLADFTDFAFARSMGHAVETAAESAEKGTIILFSPGCASFDMYKDYAHRGEDFMDQVKQLEQRVA